MVAKRKPLRDMDFYPSTYCRRIERYLLEAMSCAKAAQDNYHLESLDRAMTSILEAMSHNREVLVNETHEERLQAEANES
jgi:hypothetical protein